MTTPVSSPKRATAALASLSLLASLLIGIFIAAPPALADGAGGPEPINMNTMSELPERNGWGVVNKDPNAEHNFDNRVWDFAQIGDRMYVAGSFLNVRGPNSPTEYDQPYLAAFDVNTGVWDPSFAPDLDGPVFALEVNFEGDLIAGGQFSSLNGLPNTSGLVGINPADGSKSSGFQASVERPFSPNKPAIVRSLEVIGNDLYVAGNFNFVRGNSDGSRTQVYNITRVDSRWGTPDNTWKPNVAGGGIWGFGIDTARNRIHFGGINITTVNGQSVNRLGTVYLDSGQNVPNQAPFEFNYTLSQRDIWDVEVANGKVWVSGEQHTMVILNGDTREREAFHSTGLRGNTFLPYPGTFAGGAFQLVEQMGNWIIAGCHCTYEYRSTNNFTGNSWYDSVADVRRPVKIAGAINASTGEALNWSPDLATTTQGAWAAHSDTNGCLWLGGDFGLGGLEAGAAFWVGSLARFCSPGGVPVANTITCLATTLPNGNVLVSWNNLGANGHDVGETGAAPVWNTGFSWVDTSPGTSYTVTAYGNGQTDTCVVDEHLGGGGGPGGFTCDVTNNPGSVTVSWADQSASGYDVSEDGGAPVWRTGTSFTDVTPGTTYSITAWGGPNAGTTATCTNANPGGGGWDCTVTNNANGSATISWPDIGANGYDLARDGGTPLWITNTSFVDFTPGTNYSLTAWGGGVGGTTTSCTNPNPGGGGWSCTVTNNANGSVTIAWGNIGANGYDLAQDGGTPLWQTGTSFVDFTPGTNYTLTAWGGGVGGTTTSCTNPNPGGGGWNCTASTNIDGTVTISWGDIGANGYDVAHDGGPASWVVGTTWVDSTPGSNYTLTAWGGGVGGTTTNCTV